MSEFRRQLRETGQVFRAVFANRSSASSSWRSSARSRANGAFSSPWRCTRTTTAGPRRSALVLVIRWVASALTAPWLAYFADRYRRERVMLAADLSRVAAMAGMAAAAFTGAPPVIVYVLAGFMAVASKTFRPAQAALLPLAGRVAGGAHGGERDLDRDRERRDVPRARRSAACCSRRRASAGSSSPTRSRSSGRRSSSSSCTAGPPTPDGPRRSASNTFREAVAGFSTLGRSATRA